MDATPPSNWGTVLDDQRKTLFISRDEQLDAFSGNLDRDHPRYLVLALHGQGGIGPDKE